MPTANAATVRRLHTTSRRTAAMAVALACFVSVHADGARAQVPTVNIRETCQAAASVTVNLSGPSSGGDLDICLKSEGDAQQRMIKEWSSFEPSDRADCIQPNVYLPSYTEWLTCFEMNKVVREMRQRGEVTRGLLVTNRDGSYTLPTLGRAGRQRSSY